MPFWRKVRTQEPVRYSFTLDALEFRVPALCVACGAPSAQAAPIPGWFEPDKDEKRRLKHFRGGTMNTVSCGTQGSSVTLTFPLCFEHSHLALPPEMRVERTKAERKERARLISESVTAKMEARGAGWATNYRLHLSFANETFAKAFAQMNALPDRYLSTVPH